MGSGSIDHSVMWKSLPSWIWIGASLLAFLAGMVNMIGFLGFQHQALTHMTGLTSRLAEGIAEQNLADVGTVATIMISFVGGAALSGLVIRDSALQWGRRYGVALFFEAMLLALAALLVNRHLPVGFCVASFACGLQNAMASNFSGSAIRTTHVSGMFTDLGIFIGHTVRRVPIDRLRLLICISTITGFAAGGVVSVVLFQRIGANALYVPAGLAVGLAIAYQSMLWRLIARR